MLDKKYVFQVLDSGKYIGVFTAAVRGAIQDWFQLVATNPTLMQNPKAQERSAYINRRTVQRARRSLAGQDGVQIHDNKQYKTTVFVINNEIVVRLKKLSAEMRPMNILTKRVNNLWYQNMSLPGEFERWINITFGWQLDRQGLLQRLGLVYEKGNKINWLIELDPNGATYPVPVQTALIATLPESNDPAPYGLEIVETDRTRRIEENNAEDVEDEAQ